MSSSNNGSFIDGLFLTILFGNILLIAMLTPFIDSGFTENDLTQKQANVAINARFSNFGFNVQTAVEMFTIVSFAIVAITSGITGFFNLFGAVFSIYASLGLFGTIILSLNAIIGSLFFLFHIESISNVISGVVRAIGSLIPFT